MTTTLYLLDTPKYVNGTLPLDTQFPSFTVVSPGIRQNGYSIPRTLSTTAGIVSNTIPGLEYAASYANNTTSSSFFRLFVSDPVVGGFYVPGPIRFYGSMFGKNLVANVKSAVKLVCYFWRPSTGAIVAAGAGTQASNVQITTGTFIDGATNTTVGAYSGDFTGLGPEYGWVVQTGDVFVLELAIQWANTSGLNNAIEYQVLFGGNSQVSATTVSLNPSNPTSFIQLPFDLAFQQSTLTKQNSILYRDMFAVVGS